MSETWTPSSSTSETWTNDTTETRVFSPLVFSHAYVSTLRVFALGSSAGVYDVQTSTSESWVAA